MRHTVYWRGIWNEMYCLLRSGKKCTVYCGKEQQAQWGTPGVHSPLHSERGWGVRLYTVYSSSWNSGSSGTTITGFCCAAFRMSAGTYLLSTTRRKVYSLNQRLVMIRQPC